jgi:hypothetical protein
MSIGTNYYDEPKNIIRYSVIELTFKKHFLKNENDKKRKKTNKGK